jgi:hypothetical protein
MAAKKKAKRSEAMRKAWQTRRARSARAERPAAPRGEPRAVLLGLDTLERLQRRLQSAAPSAPGNATVSLTTEELALLAYALGNLSALARMQR